MRGQRTDLPPGLSLLDEDLGGLVHHHIHKLVKSLKHTWRQKDCWTEADQRGKKLKIIAPRAQTSTDKKTVPSWKLQRGGGTSECESTHNNAAFDAHLDVVVQPNDNLLPLKVPQLKRALETRGTRVPAASF
jgi:hypothetical protein